jgi:hypothetical protein
LQCPTIYPHGTEAPDGFTKKKETMKNGAAGSQGIQRTIRGLRASANRGAARIDMMGLTLFCAVDQTEWRMVLDRFTKTTTPCSENLDIAPETVAVPVQVTLAE